MYPQVLCQLFPEKERGKEGCAEDLMYVRVPENDSVSAGHDLKLYSTVALWKQGVGFSSKLRDSFCV